MRSIGMILTLLGAAMLYLGITGKAADALTAIITGKTPAGYPDSVRDDPGIQGDDLRPDPNKPPTVGDEGSAIG